MTPSQACIDMIANAEGRRLKAYPDPGTGGDPWTIGVGHTGPEVHAGLVWTQQQVDETLRADLAKTANRVSDLIGTSSTTQHQFDALVSFAFNVGLGNLASSTLLAKHRGGNFAGAQAEFARWNKAAGKVLAGLTKRRAAEATLYATTGAS